MIRVFRQPKITWDFFLLPYGNKCHVFFPMSLIALSAVQFSKYLPLSAESLLHGKLFLSMYSPVLCAAKACAWEVGYQGAARSGCLQRALWQDPARQQHRPRGGSQAQPRVRIPTQVHSDEARLGHHTDPEPWQPNLPELGCSQGMYIEHAELPMCGSICWIWPLR